MSDKTSSGSGGMGFFSALLIVFITLKLCGVIDWSWWLVFMPLWISLGIAALCLIAFGITCFIANRVQTWDANRQNPRK